MSADKVIQRKIFHVMPENGNWQVLEESSSRRLGNFAQKQDAIEAASQAIGESEQVRVVVHKSDGSIESRQDFPQVTENGEQREYVDLEDDYIEIVDELDEEIPQKDALDDED